MMNTAEAAPREYVRALRHSQDRLANLVTPLSPKALMQPSYHAWSLAEVLGHLGSQSEIFSLWTTNALEHSEAAGREAMQPIWDSWDARTPDAQARDGLGATERLVQRFEALTDDELAGMYLNFFGMEVDGGGLVRMRLAEHAVHSWDIEVALDPEARVLPDAVALLIDTLEPLASRVGKPLDRSFSLHVSTREPEREFLLRSDTAVELSAWDRSETDGRIDLGAEAFLRLVYGRLDAGGSESVEVDGPIGLDDLRSVFAGV